MRKNNVVEHPTSSSDIKPIKLLPPKLDNRKSLVKALQQRKTIREISDKKLSLQALSNLLWAACRVNRKKGPFGIPGRTTATPSNSQKIDVYFALQEGIYKYNTYHHKLISIVAGNLRSLAIGLGQSKFGANSSVRLIYIADMNKLFNTSGYQEPGLHDPEIQKSYYYIDTGLIAGNVYLFASAQGLAS